MQIPLLVVPCHILAAEIYYINILKVGLTHLCRVDFSNEAIWTGPFLAEGVSGVFITYYNVLWNLL